MAEGAKRAHADLNIDVEGPKEELDVVTDRAQDYSPAIENAVTKNKGLFDAFDHLGNIADNANELNRTINAYDWDVDYNDRYQEMSLEQKRLDDAQRIDIFNTVSGTRVEMLRDIEKAKEEAKANPDMKVTDAVQGVLDNYRDVYSDSLEASSIWSNIYNHEYASEIQQGINTDYAIQQKRMYHNMDQIQNEVFQKVSLGAMSIDAGINKLLTDTESIRGSVPYNDYINSLDTCYNQLTIAKALNLAKVANGGNATEVAAAIRNLVQTHGKKSFTCLDKQGKPMTDEQGNPITYDASLTPETVRYLLQTAQEYEHKASSAGISGATKTYEQYKEYVGGVDLEKNGISDYLTFATPASAQQDYNTIMQNLMADPNLTTKQKIEKRRQVSELYWTTVQPAVATYSAMQLTPDARTNHTKLQQKLAEIDKALASGQNMTDFSVSFDMDGGGTFTLKPDVDYSLAGSADPKQAAHNYWRTIRDTISKTLNADTKADFLYGTNADFTLATNRAKTALGRNALVNTSGEKSWINSQGTDALTEYLKDMKAAHTDAAGKSGAYSAVPKVFLDQYAAQYNECATTKQQNDYARAVAMSLVNSGYSGLLMSSTVLQTKSEAEKKAYNELQKEIYLSAPNLSHVRAVVTQSSMQGTGYYTVEAAKDFLDQKGLSGKDLVNHMSQVVRDNKIPAEYQESFMTAMANVAVAYGVAQQFDPNITKEAYAFGKLPLGGGDLKDALNSMAKQNFISMDSQYIKGKVYIGNPALLQGKPLKEAHTQAKEMSKLVTDVCDNMHSSLKTIGETVKKDHIAAEFDSITGRVTFRVEGGGLGLSNASTGAFGSFISVPYNYKSVKPQSFTDAQWTSEVSDYISTSAVLSFMKDPDSIKKKALVDPYLRTQVNSKTASTEAIRMLSVLQRDDFLTNYSQAISSGGKLGVSPAPSYMKEIFQQKETSVARAANMTKNTDTKSLVNVKDTPESVSRILDFAYSKSTAYNKVDLTVNKPLSYDMQGLNYSGVMSVAHANGFVITRDYDTKQYGNKNVKSKHASGMALDFGVYSNNMEDRVTGLVKVSSMKSFTDMLTKNPAYKNRVNFILTSRPELLENKPEYAAFADFRKLKNSEGKPLFRDARGIDKHLPKDNNHRNHFHVDFKEQVVDSKHRDFIAAYPALADDMSKTSFMSSAPLSHDVSKALLETFGSRHGQEPNHLGQFGMANLTIDEYKLLGLTDANMKDPTIHARVLGNRFQAYTNALGNQGLAVLALAGAKFKSIDDEKPMTVQEIINSGKIAGINGKRYVYAPPTRNGQLDAAKQIQQQEAYQKYLKALKNAKR